MSDDEGTDESRGVRDKTYRYARDLLAENERLRALVASLQDERRRIEDRSHELFAQLLELERQNSNLANLYVAVRRLHRTLDRQQTLASIQEIIVNLVGCQEIAIFEAAPDNSTLRLVSSLGIDARRYKTVPLARGPIGKAAASGTSFLAGPGGAAERSPEEPHLTACLPLWLDGRLIGAIAMFRFLPQKPGLENLDLELAELLATHAAIALHCSALEARLAAGAKAGA
jgi:GAF domain-containing protein